MSPEKRKGSSKMKNRKNRLGKKLCLNLGKKKRFGWEAVAPWRPGGKGKSPAKVGLGDEKGDQLILLRKKKLCPISCLGKTSLPPVGGRTGFIGDAIVGGEAFCLARRDWWRYDRGGGCSGKKILRNQNQEGVIGYSDHRTRKTHHKLSDRWETIAAALKITYNEKLAEKKAEGVCWSGCG